jgi:hypothetical protein
MSSRRIAAPVSSIQFPQIVYNGLLTQSAFATDYLVQTHHGTESG